MPRPRPLVPLLVALAALAVVLGCGTPTEEAASTFGDFLPEDTLGWVHLDDLASLEPALEEWGVMDLLVERLDTPSARQEVREALGIELAEDPRETIHGMMQDLVRADVSGHRPLHDGSDDPVFLIHLECVDLAAADRLLAMVEPHATSQLMIGTATVHVLVPEEEMQLLVGRVGAHVLVTDEFERWGEAAAAIADPPAMSLTTTAPYQQLRPDTVHPIAIYMTPDAQSEFRGVGPMAPGFNPLVMGPLMEKYGSQYGFTTMDYRLTELVSRQVLTEGSVLAPLYENPTGEGHLAGWLPAGTFFFKDVLIEDGHAKLTLIQELVRDLMDVAAEGMGEDLPGGGRDPFAEMEGALGFTLPDLFALVTEFGLAASDSAGMQMVMRAADPAGAEAILGMVSGAPVMGMMGPGEPVELAGAEGMLWPLPMDRSGKVIFMGQRDDAMVLVAGAASRATAEAWLAGLGEGAIVRAAPDHVREALRQDGYGWGYLDVAGLMALVGKNMDDELSELPPALAHRLQTAVIAGHARSLEGGVVETVIRFGQP